MLCASVGLASKLPIAAASGDARSGLCMDMCVDICVNMHVDTHVEMFVIDALGVCRGTIQTPLDTGTFRKEDMPHRMPVR